MLPDMKMDLLIGLIIRRHRLEEEGVGAAAGREGGIMQAAETLRPQKQLCPFPTFLCSGTGMLPTGETWLLACQQLFDKGGSTKEAWPSMGEGRTRASYLVTNPTRTHMVTQAWKYLIFSQKAMELQHFSVSLYKLLVCFHSTHLC